MGYRTRGMSPGGLAALAAFSFDRDPVAGAATSANRSPAKTIKAIDDYDPLEVVPEAYPAGADH